jgi:taurine transport system permease protein
MSNASTPALKTSAFKIPGEGSSAFITTVTIVVMAAAWFVVTNMGWI